MADGEGANWEGDVANKDAVDYAVQVSSFPAAGIVRVEIARNDNPASIARKLAEEWNIRQPLRDVFAIADGSLTAFLLTGELADGKHAITEMAATFDGKPREVVNSNETVSSHYNPNLAVRRVSVRLIADMESNA